MELPGLDLRPGKSVEAEIGRRFNLPISFDHALSSKEFFLVISVGRCNIVPQPIQWPLLGSILAAFRLTAIANRAFRFLVYFQRMLVFIFII